VQVAKIMEQSIDAAHNDEDAAHGCWSCSRPRAHWRLPRRRQTPTNERHELFDLLWGLLKVRTVSVPKQLEYSYY
jgi:hypothetical protein